VGSGVGSGAAPPAGGVGAGVPPAGGVVPVPVGVVPSAGAGVVPSPGGFVSPVGAGSGAFASATSLPLEKFTKLSPSPVNNICVLPAVPGTSCFILTIAFCGGGDACGVAVAPPTISAVYHPHSV